MKRAILAVLVAVAIPLGLASPGYAATNRPPPISVVKVQPSTVRVNPDIAALPLCEASGNMLCVHDTSGTQFLNTFSNATFVKFNANGNTFTFNGVTYNTGTLNEPNLSPACLGTNGNGNITRQNCTTGTGIIWLAATSGGHDIWGNRKSIQDQGVFRCLAASDSVNTILFLADFPPTAGVFERWDFD